MAEELKKTDNGVGAPDEPIKKAARKAPKKMEESKMTKTQATQEIEAKVEMPVEMTVPETPVVEEPTAEVKETGEEVKAPVNGTEAPAGLPKLFHDASAQVEKLPGSKQVREAVNKVADQVGKDERTQKAVRRVRESVKDATDQMKQGAQDLEKNPLVVAAHKVLLAGVGAAALAQEEIEDFVNRLIERGSIAESDGRRMVKDVLDQRRKQMERAGEAGAEVLAEKGKAVSEAVKPAMDDLEQRIESILAQMNIPTKEEIETLTAKITALTHKVDELKKTE